jgi:hypothetical protein
MLIALDFHRAVPAVPANGSGANGSVQLESVGRVLSSARFQTRHLRADLALQVARAHPAIPAGRYPVALAIEADGRPCLTIHVGVGALSRSYAVQALRGDEVVDRLVRDRSEHAGYPGHARHVGRESEDELTGEPLYYVATLADEPPRRGARRFALAGADRAPSSASADGLEIEVRAYDLLPEPVSLDELDQVGVSPSGALAAVIDEALLVRLAHEAAVSPGAPFVERGWYLLGRVVRNCAGGDLVLLVEDAIAALHTEATATSLVFTEQTKLAAQAALETPAHRGRTLVGWVHTHGRAEARDASAANGSKGQDQRFFSTFDVALHRKDFGPDAIALVIDADVASPTELARTFACFGTVDGLVVPRGFHVLGHRTEVHP